MAELLAQCKRAAELFATAELPLGEGTQNADDYAQQLSATTGFPLSLVRRNMTKLTGVLEGMAEVLAGLTRGLDLSVLDASSSKDGQSYQAQSDGLGVILPSNSPGVHGLWLPAIPLKMPLVLKPGRSEPWTPWRLAEAFMAAGTPRETFQGIPYQTIVALAESPLKIGLLYAGTDDGRLWTTRDGGDNWIELTNKVVPGRWVSRTTPSAFDEGTVYVTQNGKRDHDWQAYIFMSTDYGETWTDISEGIPGGPVNVIREDPKNPDILYVGTDLGIYVSLDRGQTWDVLANNLPNTFVHDLIVHPRDDVLVIATHGRGMYAMDVRPIREAAQ